MSWEKHIKVKNLFTEKEDYKSLQKCMKDIVKVLEKELPDFNCKDFHKLPKGDKHFTTLDYTNKMLNRLYDYADLHRIWIH
jgi:hypothetical protein